MRPFRLIPTLAVALLLAACSTDGNAPFAPADPSFSTGGHSTGGNRDGETLTTDSDDLTVQSDTTDRSGGHSTGGN